MGKLAIDDTAELLQTIKIPDLIVTKIPVDNGFKMFDKRNTGNTFKDLKISIKQRL